VKIKITGLKRVKKDSGREKNFNFKSAKWFYEFKLCVFLLKNIYKKIKLDKIFSIRLILVFEVVFYFFLKVRLV
jgi:hypothetical protein